jgi:hypothetical protein
MSAHRSLIDAVIIELVLPESRYEPHILTAVLRDALDTTPREEAKKFSQNVFDALGNFVALIEMKDMLTGQLYGEEGYAWLKMPRKEAAGEIDEFFDVITQSLEASGLCSRWQNWAYPLRKTKSQAQLDDLWKQINTVRFVSCPRLSLMGTERCTLMRQDTPSILYGNWRMSANPIPSGQPGLFPSLQPMEETFPATANPSPSPSRAHANVAKKRRRPLSCPARNGFAIQMVRGCVRQL